MASLESEIKHLKPLNIPAEKKWLFQFDQLIQELLEGGHIGNGKLTTQVRISK